MRVTTVETILTNLPGRHILKLHFDETTDFVFADICSDAAGEIVKNFGIFGENDGRATDFFDDGSYDILLVLDTVAVASSIRFALAGKSQSHSAIHMNVPFWNGNIAVSPGDKFLIGININAADSIDKIHDSREIYFEIIINFNI